MFESFIEFLKSIGLLFIRRKPKEETNVPEERLEVEEVKKELDDKYPNNFVHYPYNIFKPEIITVDGDMYTRYRAKFNSLYDLYEYLKSNPRVNSEVFPKLQSVMKKKEFSGISYDNAIEELVGPPRADYQEFVQLTDRLNEDALGYVQEYVNVKSAGGGYVDIPSYVTGSPLCYRSTKSVYTPKFVTVDICLSYNADTTKKQVFNRALIIAALINAFEQAGYMVGVNTFSVTTYEDEISQIDVNIKNTDETFNKASLYKSLCYVEFLRRLLFRVMESLNFHNTWSDGYGHLCSEKFIREVKQCDENSVFFDQPDEMGIEGKDIAKDFDAVVSYLSLEDKIDVEKAKADFKKDIAVLRRTIK